MLSNICCNILIFVTGQQPPPHVVRMLELGQSSVGGGGGAPTIQAPPPSNGFPTSSAMNMNMKPDNNSPSSSSQSPVPPSKLITSAGIPFQPHNLASYHHSPLKSEGPGPGGKIFMLVIFCIEQIRIVSTPRPESILV